MERWILVIGLLIGAAEAGAQTLTADGSAVEGSPGIPSSPSILGLIHDGSFEFGDCGEGSAWTCADNTTCSWILDPQSVWGYPAYDGALCAWLGGFCGTPNSNSFCQEVFLDGWTLDWYWMGYVNSECGEVTITADGEEIWSHTMQFSEHTFGRWYPASRFWPELDITAYCGTWFELCFIWTACEDGVSNDSMLIDYVTVRDACNDPVAKSSISTVKARY